MPLKLILATLFFIQPIIADSQSLQRFEFSEVHMGTLFRIVLYADSQTKADDVSRKAFDRVVELNGIFSDYVESSELSKISKNAYSQKVIVSDEMWTLLSKADSLYSITNGSFNVAMGPLTKLWRRAIRRQELPSLELLNDALRRSQWTDVILNKSSQSIKFKREGMRLDMGGIAKGYAVDQVYQLLKNDGVSIALVDGGGDIFAGNPPPNQDGWKVTVQLDGSSTELLLKNEAVACSGARFKHLVYENTQYSHIVDPKSGYGISSPALVNIKANSCMLADALATCCSIINENLQILTWQEQIQFEVLR